MSSSEGTEARRPLRTAGSALLGSAVIAALIGLVIVLTGDEQDNADSSRGAIQAEPPAPASSEPAPATSAPLTPTSTEPAPTEPGPTTPAKTPPPPRTEASPDQPGPDQFGAGQAGSDRSGDQGGPDQIGTAPSAGTSGVVSGPSRGRAEQSRARGQLRVYNNSTISGLAARAADDFTAAGWTVTEVGNYSAGRIPTTTVYYRKGTQERSVAEALATEFGLRVEPRFAGLAHASPGVIVIVTKDYRS